MKINKYISIDSEIFKKLQQESNASQLIEQQLRAYYNIKECENIGYLEEKLREINAILKENRKKHKEITSKLDKLKQKNKEFFENFKKSYPKDLVEELKKIENLDYDTAVRFAKNYNLINRGIGGFKLIKIWEEIRKNVLEQKSSR